MLDMNINDFIQFLDKEKNFFSNVEEINQYNIGSIVEVIQYYNIKMYSDPIYKKSEIRRAIKKYFLYWLLYKYLDISIIYYRIKLI